MMKSQTDSRLSVISGMSFSIYVQEEIQLSILQGRSLRGGITHKFINIDEHREHSQREAVPRFGVCVLEEQPVC